jgi:hypothetical protein
VAERLRTRTLLSNSEPARAWAAEIAAQLAPLETELPDIPPAQPQQQPQRLQDLSAAAAAGKASAASAAGGGSSGESTGSPAASQPRSSRLGGAILLAAIVVVVIVAVLLITDGGGKKTSTSSTSSAVTTKTGPTVENQIALKPPASPKSGSIGVVEILAEKGKQAFFIEAQHIPESKGFYYAIWLYNSPSSALALSKSPAVGSTEQLQ